MKQGLLNNRDAQFLFSSVTVPGGPDGTPSFVPAPPPAGKIGAVTVQRGAQISSTQSGDGNGGRVMLVGPEVTNDGTISTPGGQTVLAAGNQIAIAAHASNDPSLRGIDVWVGRVETGAGTAMNSGIISAPTGAITITGRSVNQNGIADSTTGVSLNGRIDLIASYGAVANPNFDNSGTIGFNGPPFLYQYTGVVTLGPESVTRILPDYASTKAVPGTVLPENSQFNAEGLAIHLGQNAMVLAPSGNVSLRAGVFPYKDADGNGTTLKPDGSEEANLGSFIGGRLLFSSGQIYLNPGAFINVAGSTEVSVPLSQSILTVTLRGSELADSPLQRASLLRGVPLTVDIRRSGVYNGVYWVGTPLGDVTGVAGIIERNVAQLTVNGGTVNMQAGNSIVVQDGAAINVSGGYYRNEGGMVQTSRLLLGGHLVDIQNALPSQTYDGVYTGTYTVSHSRWGVTKTFASPWMSGMHYEASYVHGGGGGTLNLTAASMAVDGALLGLTVTPPRSLAVSPLQSSISLSFAAEQEFKTSSNDTFFITASQTPPAITFGTQALASTPAFSLVNDTPVALPAERTASVVLSPALLTDSGFAHLTVENSDGSITVPSNVPLTTVPGGSISLTGANVTVQSRVTAPGGSLSFRTSAISPVAAAKFPIVNPAGALSPVADGTRGIFILDAGAALSTAGLIVDDRIGTATAYTLPLVNDGGSIAIKAYSAKLATGSIIDVSGGVAITGKGAVTYGKGGSIEIRTGKDPGFATVAGGRLLLGSSLVGYSGKTGGSLTIQAGQIQVGGATTSSSVVLLPEEFFSRGGFTSYSLEGIGAPSAAKAASGEPDVYCPAISVAPGSSISATAETLALVPVKSSQTLQFHPVLRSEGERVPVSISFNASGLDDPYTTGILEIRGDIVVGAGAKVVTDAGGTISFKGQTVSMSGSVLAPGGKIFISGASSFPVPTSRAASATLTLPTVVIGAKSLLSAAGTTVLQPDPYGRRQGTLYPGGTISVSGNIVASAGAVLDVSGASGTFDVHPSSLGNAGAVSVPLNSGVTAPLWKLKTVAVTMDSNGGTIDLSGSKMLFTDATLLGRAGGQSATGGTLSVSSGRFYIGSSARTSADINFVVTQDGHTIPSNNDNPRVGVAIRSGTGTAIPGMGYFSVSSFANGGFNSLDLAAKFINGSPISFGGNVEFQGPVSITAKGSLRVAAGGIIKANAAVNLTANYVALGQIFQAPPNPSDVLLPFVQFPVITDDLYTFAPTSGSGTLTVKAKLIDVGTLSLQGISHASLIADGGDIRGNGTFNMAGDLTLRAGQIYPTTLSSFDIFAYDEGTRPGSVTIVGSGSRPAPLSAGGSLRIFASKITQGGVLRAPFGSITLGWDGTDQNTATPTIDGPSNAVAGATIAVPIAAQVTLQSGSVTSVAARTGNGTELLIPYGLSTDGNSWIDPRGVNITVSGAPEKRITIAGNSVSTQAGSTVDLRGGGDLYAYRWVSGVGGSTDLLGAAGGAWTGASEYQPGSLVTFGNQTWSARVRNTGQTPTAGTYWSQVATSYAILPGYTSEFAPYAPFNTGSNATALGGDPGYASGSLKLGDRIYLEATPGLAAGTYTLLPRRYALLAGAFLVTPTTGNPYGTVVLPTGATSVAGFRLNEFNQPQTIPTLRTQFELASSAVVNARASYDNYYGNAFLASAATQFNTGRVQRLPGDAGYLGIQGNASLGLDGSVLAGAAAHSRGAMIDVSSLADIQIIGGTGTATGSATAVLNAETLTAWGPDSLLIGGLRTRGADQTAVDVHAGNIVLNNPGGAFRAGEIVLVSKAGLTVAAGSSISASGHLSEKADTLTIPGDGTMVRVSSDAAAAFTRTNTTGSIAPLLIVAGGANIAGATVVLDSNYGTSIDPTTVITSRSLDLGSGQISILLGAASSLTGSVVPQHLELKGQLLQDAQRVLSLTLRSDRTVDVYGAGTFGSPLLNRLAIFGSGMRGYNQGVGTAGFIASEITLSNPDNRSGLAAPTGLPSGTLQMDAGTVRLGQNAFPVAGWQNVVFNASSRLLGDGVGSFAAVGAGLTINTPLITGTRGSNQSVTADGVIVLKSTPGSSAVAGGLGAGFIFTGASVLAGTNILLPSGPLTLRATGAGQAVTVSGTLNVAGSAQNFYDLTRYADAGTITLTSDQGDVNLLTGAGLSVAADAGGGNAGTVSVNAAQGAFNINAATLLGSALTGATTGSFNLDAKTLPSFTDLATALNSGGFFENRSLRLRTGDVTISNPGGKANVARSFTLAADTGKITVAGTVDASGAIGGKIALFAGGSIELQGGSLLTVHARDFSSAGKGGDIRIETGAAINGTASTTAKVTMLANSTIDLGVDTYVAGDYLTPGSSAFEGKFTGTLHLRAPRNGNDVQVDTLLGNITGASSVVVEGYRLYNQSSGVLNNALRATINTDATNYMNAGYSAMFTKLTTGNPAAAALGQVLVIAPGVEIYNASGDLTLGTAVTGLNSEDWNLSTFRYGLKKAPGILTLRASGDIVFNNTLSDGFTPVTASAANGYSTMWLAQLAPVVTANGLPVNTQSWSYRIAAGSDFSSATFSAVLPIQSLAPGKGSVLVGEFYPATPNTDNSGATPAIGSDGLTANSIRITDGDSGRTRFEVVRTGTGDIEIAAGLDVQLRNQFATIYTAGVRIPVQTQVFSAGDFVVPIASLTGPKHPDQGDLGAPQQRYPAQWSLAGGNVTLAAQGNIGRFTLMGSDVVPDSSRQLPNNWLYRRGYYDPGTGLFAEGGIGTSGSNSGSNVSDASASTAWWIDYSNFFEGIGTLGGGNISMIAGADVINADALIPTNARMPGRVSASGPNVAPDASKLLEFGGGDLLVKAGHNIDGGVYYVERGNGILSAGGSITTNSTRSPSLGYLGTTLQPATIVQSTYPAVYDPATWLPTTLFVGKSQFDVTARGSVLLGPVTDTFLLPQGLDNKFWYKTYFNTVAPDAGATVRSFSGSVTQRLAVTLPGQLDAIPILSAWLGTQNVYSGSGSDGNASNYQPWIRLVEADITSFTTQLQVEAPNLQMTAFSGDINIVGKATMFPSATGRLELAASGGIIGTGPTGRTQLNGNDLTVWTSSSLNLSDADPSKAPGIATPLGYQTFTGRSGALNSSRINPFGGIDPLYLETGSYSGLAGSIVVQQALHASTPVHAGDTNPVRLYARSGDISGLTLFAPKATEVLAGNDITDVALYVQNVHSDDISIVAAGRNLIPNNPNAPLRSLANDASRGNLFGGQRLTTSTGSTTNALPGDIQISGPGVLEVLAGQKIDLGTEPNLLDGTGTGINSIGNFRNPSLPFSGADMIVFAGMSGIGGTGPAFGLAGSSLDLSSFIQSYGMDPAFQSAYLDRLGVTTGLAGLTSEQKALVGLEIFYRRLRDAGRSHSMTGDYASGFSAVGALLANHEGTGSIFTRARDIRTSANGSISIGVAGGGLTMASDIFGNPLTPPGIVTEYGGAVSVFTDQSVDIGRARIFTLRGGDIVIWSSNADIAAGTAPKTVVTAPPTRVLIDINSADVKTDLGGLATGGGIGVLASVAGVKVGDVDLIAPKGVVDAGDAGIRSTGNLNIAATTVLNASNIQVAGTTSGASSGPSVAAPNISGLTSASNQSAASSSTATDVSRTQQHPEQPLPKEEPASIFNIEILGYGGGD
ncbi:MAG: filamentous hemagglutinin family protein [Verrucomicrobia bacterium]|nr:filamentous hemagglutinin family protein [Verrucomicrobiota bacterium]